MLNLIEKIKNIIKKIFFPNKMPLLNESNEENIIKEKIDLYEDKNIIMYLYKQLRLNNIEVKYIPDEYLEPIIELLKEETNITEDKIKTVKNQILINKREIQKLRNVI